MREKAQMEIVLDNYSHASNLFTKWVLAVPENSDIKAVKDLEGKSIAIVE